MNFRHKDCETIDEWFSVRSALAAYYRRRQLEKQNYEECVLQKALDPLGEKFPFQCKCGETYQFLYKENEGDHYLVVMLSCSKKVQVDHVHAEECQSGGQHCYSVNVPAYETPNVPMKGRD